MAVAHNRGEPNTPPQITKGSAVNEGKIMAEICDLLTRAATLWVELVDQGTPPTGTLDNRFLGETEAAYFAACQGAGRVAYHDPIWDTE